jgi:hypothetical protein
MLSTLGDPMDTPGDSNGTSDDPNNIPGNPNDTPAETMLVLIKKSLLVVFIALSFNNKFQLFLLFRSK